MGNIQKTGRIIFALPFAVFGLNHFMYADMLSGIVPAFLPLPVVIVYLTGLFLIASAILISIDKFTKEFSIGLAAFLIVIALSVHLPGIFNPETMGMSMPGMLKDLSLAGGALLVVSLKDNQK